MQRQDEGRKAGRPSLLTPAQQAEAERNRILTTLESGRGATKSAGQRERRRPSWLVVGLGALALLVAAGVWVTRDASQEHLLASVASVAAVSKDDAVTATAGADAAAPAAPGGTTATAASSSEVTADEVLAANSATINDDKSTQAAPDKQPSLSEMLSAGAAPAKADHDELSKALETSADAPVAKAAPKAAAKPAHTESAKKAEKPKAAPKPAPKPETKTVRESTNTPEQESDIALLSALMAHAKSADAAEAPKKVRLSLKEQLAQCKKFSKAKAEQCRERICDGRTKTGDCKVQR